MRSSAFYDFKMNAYIDNADKYSFQKEKLSD